MAYELPESISFDRMRQHCFRIAAGAASRGMPDLAAKFRELAAQTKAEGDAREMADVEVSNAQVLVAVELADTHSSVRLLSRRAYDLANKKAKAEPYKNLFGTHKADIVKSWGADRTVDFIRDTAAKAQDYPQLSDETAAMVANADSLQDADRRRDEAEREASRFEFVRARRRDIIEEAMDEAEVEILMRHLGRHDLVQAILSTNYLRSNRRKTAMKKAAAKKAEAAKDCDLTSKDQSPQ